MNLNTLNTDTNPKEPTPIAYPTMRMLGNPSVIEAIANHFEIDTELFSSVFYTLQEAQLDLKDEDEELKFESDMTLMSYDEKESSLMVQSTSTGIYALLKVEDIVEPTVVLQKINKVNKFILGCLEKAAYLSVTDKTKFKGNIETDQVILDPPPTPKNRFLCSATGNSIEGGFHFLSNTSEKYNFVINILDPETKKVETLIEDGEIK